LKSGESKYTSSWSPDGRYLMYTTSGAKTGLDLSVLPLEGEKKPFPFLQTEFQETGGQFSPGPASRSRWVAYNSNETGREEVYVQGFPKPGGKWQVSTGGGLFPLWRADGRELFYLSADRKLMAVDVKTDGPVFERGQPRELFPTTVIPAFSVHQPYDVTADGKRFLILSTLEDAEASPITVVLNWKGR